MYPFKYQDQFAIDFYTILDILLVIFLSRKALVKCHVTYIPTYMYSVMLQFSCVTNACVCGRRVPLLCSNVAQIRWEVVKAHSAEWKQ